MLFRLGGFNFFSDFNAVFVENVLRAFNQRRAVANQFVAALAPLGVNFTGDCEDIPPVFAGVSARDKRAAFLARLHDDNPSAEPRDDSVARREGSNVRAKLRRKFAEDDAAFSHLLEKIFLAAAKRNFNSATQNCNGSSRLECSAVCEGVNAARRPADDRQARRRQLLAEFQRDALTVLSVLARTDNSNPLRVRLQLSAVIEKHRRRVNFFEQRRIIFVGERTDFEFVPLAVSDEFFGRIGVFAAEGNECVERLLMNAGVNQIANVRRPRRLGTAAKLHEFFYALVAETFRAAHRRQVIPFHDRLPPAPYNTTKFFPCKFFAASDKKFSA